MTFLHNFTGKRGNAWIVWAVVLGTVVVLYGGYKYLGAVFGAE